MKRSPAAFLPSKAPVLNRMSKALLVRSRPVPRFHICKTSKPTVAMENFFRSAIAGGLLAGHGQVATDLRHSAFSDKSVAGIARLFVQLHKKQKSSLDGFLFKFKHCTSHFQSPFRETNLACKPPISSFCHAFSEAQMCFIASCIVKLIWPSMAYLCTGSKQIRKRLFLTSVQKGDCSDDHCTAMY